jgi:hypothetical protein
MAGPVRAATPHQQKAWESEYPRTNVLSPTRRVALAFGSIEAVERDPQSLVPTLSTLHDKEHWLKRAGEARAQAEQMSDPEAKRQLVEIAEAYERLAILAAHSKMTWWTISTCNHAAEHKPKSYVLALVDLEGAGKCHDMGEQLQRDGLLQRAARAL